jgi:hypothetical protein
MMKKIVAAVLVVLSVNAMADGAATGTALFGTDSALLTAPRQMPLVQVDLNSRRYEGFIAQIPLSGKESDVFWVYEESSGFGILEALD